MQRVGVGAGGEERIAGDDSRPAIAVAQHDWRVDFENARKRSAGASGDRLASAGRRLENDVAALQQRLDLTGAGVGKRRLQRRHRQPIGAADVDAAQQGDEGRRYGARLSRCLASPHSASISSSVASAGARPTSASRDSI